MELDALSGRQQLDADHHGGVFGHERQASCRIGRHRNVVLLIGGGRDTVDAAGMGERLVLGHQRRRRRSVDDKLWILQEAS